MDQKDPSTSTTGGAPWGKLVIVGVIAAVIVTVFVMYRDVLTLDWLAQREAGLRQFQQDHPVLVYVIAFVVYVAVTGSLLPGATGLTLVYAWYFGFVPGVILVSFASTTGATVAFSLSRYLFRDAIQSRFQKQLATFNRALDREGAFYLFTLRLIPAAPFFVINVVMGLTRIRTVTFWWVSQLGMLAGTCVYVYAGSSIPSLSHLADSSQLRPADINDWNALFNKLRGAAANEAANTGDRSTGPAGQIWSLLPDDAKAAIKQSSGEPNSDLKMTLIAGLNELMTRPDFAIDEDWRKAVTPSGDDPEERRPARKRLTKANRDILVAAFPDIISPPQPILSTKLIIAFVVLGVFPLVAKKVIERVRRAPSRHIENHEANDQSDGDDS